MNAIPDILISDFDYELPEHLIALYPENERDRSKMLVWNSKNITSDIFSGLPKHIDPDTLFIFNDTKVINARLKFEKPSGSQIEIFVLEPVAPSAEINVAFGLGSGVVWKCMVGNLKRWKNGMLTLVKNVDGKQYELFAVIVDRFHGTCHIKFTWTPSQLPFSAILEIFGIIPLPPYIQRTSELSDQERYQTIYAQFDGSVAAPTAGLHFTKKVFHDLKSKNAHFEYLTLHVGAGTFKPVDQDKITEHQMHQERIVVNRKTIVNLLNHKGPNIAVGTTSVRTLESMYLYACLLMMDQNAEFQIGQWVPYLEEIPKSLSRHEAMEVLLNHLKQHDLEYLSGMTSLMILPGYRFHMIDGMVTNFHLPKSTLLLLISAFIGDDWKSIYQFAIANNYRFLSYGDACLFLK